VILIFENRELFHVETLEPSGDGEGQDVAHTVNEQTSILLERDFEPVEYHCKKPYDGDGFGNPYECCDRDF